MFPIFIRFFGENGIENRLLDVHSNATETAEDVTNLIKKSLFDYNLDPQLFTSFCADNTSTNFGGVKRRGLNNVYRLLKNDVNAEIVGVGCGSHVLDNASQKGTDKLLVNVPRLAMEIRSHFSSQSKRWAKLGEFCEFVGEIKHEPLPSHADTRWLTLLLLVTRILKLWPALESYFRSTDDCSNDLKKMFCEEKSAYYQCYFLFLDYALPMFNANDYTFVESIADIRKLILQLTAKSESTFFGFQVQKLLEKIEMEQGKHIQDRILTSFQAFFKRTTDYIQEWTSSLEEYGDRLDWIMLEDSTAVESVDEESLTLSIATISSVLAEDHFIGSDLLEMKETISSLRPNKDFWELPIDKKWRILLRNKNFRVLSSFIPKPKRKSVYKADFAKEFHGIKKGKDDYHAHCIPCKDEINLTAMGKTAIKQHQEKPKHKENAKAAATTSADGTCSKMGIATTVMVEANIDAICELLRANPRTTFDEVEEKSGLSRDTLQKISHEKLSAQKKFCHFVPH
uniref:Uncharacterized protein n=1 Tax=Plectus sambesii TaxID=2011161 RepID=A0A914W2U3_9BILA